MVEALLLAAIAAIGAAILWITALILSADPVTPPDDDDAAPASDEFTVGMRRWSQLEGMK